MNMGSKKFRSLSVKDLLDAREHYHLHLMNKRNVIATAISRYRFRKDEHLLKEEKKTGKAGKKEPKQLDNTEVRRYSWPCVLVFVDKWAQETDFVPDDVAWKDKTKTAISDMVPTTLFLPDGREVPVCVIYAQKEETGTTPIDYNNLVFPRDIIGGGYPVLTTVQEEDHIATIGCLVTDGHYTYALTNRHVSGEPGEILSTRIDGRDVRIGRSARKQLTRKKFSEVYKKWPGTDVYLTMDIGLIEIDDLNKWTAQIYGIGTLGQMVDLSDHTISLDLIGSNVCAFGCASRQMKGEILGLFYRYKAVGGCEYVADFLIGKGNAAGSPPFCTNHGDSASIWMLDDARDGKDNGDHKDSRDSRDTRYHNRPIAIQWGGHVFLDSTKTTRSRYALATSLSTVCNELELDLVRDLNIGLDEYWGRLGHYTIATVTCGLIKNKKLKKLMTANVNRISFEPGDITDENLKGLNAKAFVPLADVPDIAWQGRPPVRKDEAPNHFADMDQKDRNGHDLFTICRDSKNVNVDVWKAYYDDVKNEGRGVLPFRIWQIYDAMVFYVTEGKVREFVCAAGILAHYVGDSTNPLHLSYLHHGDPEDKVEVRSNKPDAKPKTRNRAEGIHDCYETDMLSRHKDEIISDLNTMAADNTPLKHVRDGRIRGGREAAITMVGVMTDTYITLKPRDMIKVYNTPVNGQKVPAAERLWKKYQDETREVMSDACRYLACLWESAWEEGGGDTTIKKLGAIDKNALWDIYKDKEFLPSHSLDTIDQVLR